jgi:hypothetical protein
MLSTLTNESQTENGAGRAGKSARPERLAYRLGQLAHACSLSIDFVQAQIRTGKLPARKIGRMVVILADDAEAWLRSYPAWTPETSRKER